jgi:hypothetical protein
VEMLLFLLFYFLHVDRVRSENRPPKNFSQCMYVHVSRRKLHQSCGAASLGRRAAQLVDLPRCLCGLVGFIRPGGLILHVQG